MNPADAPSLADPFNWARLIRREGHADGVRLAELEDRLDRLAAKVDALNAERNEVAPDEKARAARLLHAIDAAISQRVFTCADLAQHAALPTSLDLHMALAGLNNKRLGKLFGRIEGRSIDGLMVHRVGAAPRCATWMVKAI